MSILGAAGSHFPKPCAPGTEARPDSDPASAARQACTPCAGGTYSSVFGSLGCSKCDAGHVCLAGATMPNPGEHSY